MGSRLSSLLSSPVRQQQQFMSRSTKSKHSRSAALTLQDIRADKFEDIIVEDANEHHHCRICKKSFTTKTDKSFVSQWLHHRESGKHQENRKRLLQPRGDGDDDDDDDDEHEEQEEQAQGGDNDDDEYQCEDDDGDDDDDDDEFESSDSLQPQPQQPASSNNKKEPQKPKKKPKRLKLTRKNRLQLSCPFCATSTSIQACTRRANFELKQMRCASCSQHFWMHIRDGKTATVSEQYPFQSTHPHNSNTHSNCNSRKRPRPHDDDNSDIEILSPPRSKQRKLASSKSKTQTTAMTPKQAERHADMKDMDTEMDEQPRSRFTFDHVSSSLPPPAPPATAAAGAIGDKQNLYRDTQNGRSYLIPPMTHDDDDDDDTQQSHHRNSVNGGSGGGGGNPLHRAYHAQLSHIEMVSPCSRSQCSDFISGDSHCWMASPMMLPGAVHMADVGYVYECCWCGKQVCFVDGNGNDNDNDNDGDGDGDQDVNVSVAQQSRVIHAQLSAKWKSAHHLSDCAVDGPSYSRVPISLDDLRAKDRIMASDGTNWLPAWIEQIDGGKALVHFIGWNSRWDRWYHINSGMLKTVSEVRRELRLHAATRNQGLYQVMRDKYPQFVPTTTTTTNSKQQQQHKKKNIVDAELVTMHEKSEVYMDVHQMPIHDADDLILCPPLFYTTSCAQDMRTEHSVIEIVRNCFAYLVNDTLRNDDILLLYRVCQQRIDTLFFVLHCLKTAERVASYLRLLKMKEHNDTCTHS